jgi:hypothetical protein
MLNERIVHIGFWSSVQGFMKSLKDWDCRNDTGEDGQKNRFLSQRPEASEEMV